MLATETCHCLVADIHHQLFDIQIFDFGRTGIIEYVGFNLLQFMKISMKLNYK